MAQQQLEGSWHRFVHLLQNGHIRRTPIVVGPTRLHTHQLSSYSLINTLIGFCQVLCKLSVCSPICSLPGWVEKVEAGKGIKTLLFLF